MKKLVVAAILSSVGFAAFSQPVPSYEYRHRYHHRHHSGWIAPIVVSGVVGTVILRESSVPSQYLIVEPGMPKTVCSEWKEIQTSEGRIYRERSCYSE